jgi:hypothetical protein
MRKANRGVPKSPEHREKLRLANLGKKASPEARLHMSQARIGRPVTEETKRKIRESNLGLKRSEAFCKRMSEVASARRHTAEYKAAMRQALLGKYPGPASSGWKGGRRKQGGGYWLIYSPEHPCRSKSKYVLEHRLVVEKALGRYLTSAESVHHINKKKADNRPENLMAFITKGAHLRFEKGGWLQADTIIFDGRLIKHSES